MEALSGIPDASVEDIDRFPAASGLTASTASLDFVVSAKPVPRKRRSQPLSENG